MKLLLLSFLCIISTACMTIPQSTPFQRKGEFNPRTKKTNVYGLEVKLLKEYNGRNISYARFSGNSITDPSESLSGALLGAISDCSQKGYIPKILDTIDYSRKENKVGSYTTGGYKIGNTYYPSNTTVYNYKVNYPDIVVLFSCSKYVNILDAKIKTEDVNPVLIKDIVRDHRGGQLIVEVNKGPLKMGDIIINMDNKRVTKKEDLFLPQNKALVSMKYKVIRDRKIKEIDVKVKDDAPTVLKANQFIVDNNCGLSDFYKDIPICNGKILIVPVSTKQNQVNVEKKKTSI